MKVTKTAMTNLVKELDFLEVLFLVAVWVVAAFIIFVFNFDSKYPNKVPVAKRALNPLFVTVPVPNWESVS
tara:strand:+ start:60374 stop:60586 length:213 start_codon:yes stop_codon:yes gene_type:complete